MINLIITVKLLHSKMKVIFKDQVNTLRICLNENAHKRSMD